MAFQDDDTKFEVGCLYETNDHGLAKVLAFDEGRYYVILTSRPGAPYTCDREGRHEYLPNCRQYDLVPHGQKPVPFG